LFGTYKPDTELTKTSLLVEVLSRHLRETESGLQLHWLHQLNDPHGGIIDIALYVSREDDSPWIPVGVIEVGLFSAPSKAPSKQYQAVAYGINIAGQLNSEHRGLLVAELLLERNGMINPSVKLHSLAPALKFETTKNKIWDAPVWEGVIHFLMLK
jgi:hypothetical protein